MKFRSAADSAFDEIKHRMNRGKTLCKFGIQFLDDATEGIVNDDLVVIAADSGIGKTHLCTSMAESNIKDGKRVHFIPLEAGENEIERRIKFRMVADKYYSSTTRPYLPQSLTYRRWNRGLFVEYMPGIEAEVAEEFQAKYKDLFLCYKDQKFDVQDLTEQIILNADKSDLIILDHVHMMDWDEPDNAAIKKISITARDLALSEKKPLVLIGHIKKQDHRFVTSLCPDKEEIHGSSELYKVSTVFITLAPGGIDASGDCETFMRIPKCREEGSVTRYLGRTFFSPKKGVYLPEYKIGWSTCTKKTGFEAIDRDLYPSWAGNPST